MQHRDTPKYNLCIKFGDAAARCKKIPAVTRVADAKRIAYRMLRKLNAPVGSRLVIKLGRQHEGQRYWFRVRHGDIVCARGGMFGPSCD